MNTKFLEKMAGDLDQKRALEALARKKGVVLAEPAPPPAPATPPVSKGWLAKTMPDAAAMMVELREQLGPEIYKEAMENLKAGRGWVVDHSTWIAVGSPPTAEFELGKAQYQDGYTVRRVRPRTPPG